MIKNPIPFIRNNELKRRSADWCSGDDGRYERDHPGGGSHEGAHEKRYREAPGESPSPGAAGSVTSIRDDGRPAEIARGNRPAAAREQRVDPEAGDFRSGEGPEREDRKRPGILCPPAIHLTALPSCTYSAKKGIFFSPGLGSELLL